MKYIDLVFGILIQPFVQALELKFFLRGSIYHGFYYLSKELVIGSAIDDAAVAHNQT